MRRHFPGVMVIEIAAGHAAFEQPSERLRVACKRDVQHGELVPGFGVNPLEQRDVALDAGDEHARARLGQAQLVQRANAVRVAVEDVIKLHLCLRAGPSSLFWLH